MNQAIIPKFIRTPLKTHGGKNYLRNWIIDSFPKNYPDMNYIEVFGGGASVLLNKIPSKFEIYNDLDSKLYAVFRVIKEDLEEFTKKVADCEYNKDFFESLRLSENFPINLMDMAVREYALRKMSRGGMKTAFAWSERLRNGKPGDLNAWENSIKNLPYVSARLKNVEIRNQSFEDIFAEFDSPDDLLYLDPPYLSETRSTGSRKIYDFEMTKQQHEELIEFCIYSKSKIVLSGYMSNLYWKSFKDWNFSYRPIVNHSSQAKKKEIKRECLWTNF